MASTAPRLIHHRCPFITLRNSRSCTRRPNHISQGSRLSQCSLRQVQLQGVTRCEEVLTLACSSRGTRNTKATCPVQRSHDTCPSNSLQIPCSCPRPLPLFTRDPTLCIPLYPWTLGEIQLRPNREIQQHHRRLLVRQISRQRRCDQLVRLDRPSKCSSSSSIINSRDCRVKVHRLSL